MQSMHKPLVWAHRGARSLAPENTLEAARKAVETGSHGWEFDIRLTADGELFVMHDLGMLRTTNAGSLEQFAHIRPKIAPAFTLDELRSVNFGSWFEKRDPFKQVAAEAVSREDLDAYANAGMTTFREALEFSVRNGLHMNIELKDMRGFMGDHIVTKFASELDNCTLPEGSMVSSFNYEYLVRLRALCPTVPVGYLVYEMPEDIVDKLHALGAQALHPSVRKLEKSVAERVKAEGFDINVYTVNTEADMRRMIEWGITGIITDFPQRLRALLDA